MFERVMMTAMALFMMFVNLSCGHGQEHVHVIRAKGDTLHLEDRKSCADGRFYPQHPDKLKFMLSNLFSRAKDKETQQALAVIVPHAGYVFSGSVAASGINQINKDQEYEHIFIIGSSHTTAFNSASIYNKGHYQTPLGNVHVDISTATELINDHDCFIFEPEAHIKEHSIEVILPFLQHTMKKHMNIVPIIIGAHSSDVCKQIGSALKPYFNKHNLFIISSDFSHYPTYQVAQEVDKETAGAILKNDPQELIEIIRKHKRENIPQLQTSMCGWTSALAVLSITQEMDDVDVKIIDYQNSGDSRAGNKEKVVGYYSIVFSLNSKNETSMEQFDLTKDEKEILLKMARESIVHYLEGKKVPEIDPSDISLALKEHYGAFVTLHKNGKLRGCIGRFKIDGPLYKTIQQMAVSAASRDPRFSEVTKEEIEEIDIEISVLSPMRKIESINEFELGRHGIYIKKGSRSGTFLPQVAETTGWNKEEFIGHCARDKAGIGWDGWKDDDAEVYIYEAKIFSEEDFGE